MKTPVPNDLDQSAAALPMGAINELESAIQQAEALNVLFQHSIIHPNEAGEYSDNICCGFIELSASTFRRLRSAGAAVSAHAKP